MMLPLFLTLVFALLQIGYIGFAVAIVHYAASSVGRLAVENNTPQVAAFQPHFSSLMMAGLKPLPLSSTQDPAEDPLTPTVTINACASIPAYPFVGDFLKPILGGALASGSSCADNDPHAMGPVSLTGSGPYQFLIHGQTTVRMNYQPGG